MDKNAINEVVKLYKALHGFSITPKAFVTENCNIHTAKLIFAECEQLIKFSEQREIIRLKDILLRMQDFLIAIANYKAFRCCCEKTMKYIQLYNKAHIGFRNSLPKLEEDVQTIKRLLQRTLDGIYKSQSKPLDMSVYQEKKEAMVSLVQMINDIKDKYKDYDKRFNRLFNFLNNKKKNHGNGSNVDHVNNESDIYKYFNQKEEDKFVNSISQRFTGKKREVLNKSVRELIVCTMKKKVQPSEEQDTLFSNFDMFYSNLINMNVRATYFQHLFKYTKLEQLQRYIAQLQDLKIIFSHQTLGENKYRDGSIL